MGTTATAKALFMKYAEGFGLPSVSPGCIQVEVRFGTDPWEASAAPACLRATYENESVCGAPVATARVASMRRRSTYSWWC